MFSPEVLQAIREALRESLYDTRSTEDVEDRVKSLRSSMKTRVVTRRSEKKRGLPVPSKDSHDLEQEQDSLELDNLQDVLKDRREEKKRLQRVNKGGKANRRRVWKKVKKPLKP